ncbi:MAG: methyltransferase domain-containing protein [Myxococcota bacterium]
MYKTAFILYLISTIACQSKEPTPSSSPEAINNSDASTQSLASNNRNPEEIPPNQPGSGMAPKAISPPGRQMRDENEPQPGVQTDQQLEAMLQPGRDTWQKPTEVLQHAGIDEGDYVADIGCGAGYWLYHIASAIGERGKLYAVDFDANAIDYLNNTRLAENPIPNLETVLSRSFDTLLPENSIDHALLVDVHFFRHPTEPAGSQVSEDLPRFYRSIKKALKPNGTLVILEHKENYASSRQVTQDQIVEQLKPIGFELKSSSEMIDRQYFMIFNYTDD